MRLTQGKRKAILAYICLSPLTYAEIAAKFGVCYSTVANINAGWGSPRKTSRRIRSIAHAFGIK